VEEYAAVGLRTLLIGYRYVPEAEYKDWARQLVKAEQSTTDRDKEVGLVQE
jgi:hypothetical protein